MGNQCDHTCLSSNRRRLSLRIVVRYVLAHLPGMALLLLILFFVDRLVDLSAWFIWGLIVLWIAKDVALFPFVWHAYDRTDRPADTNSMLGARGVVEDRLAPKGYVRLGGELWQAELIEGSSPMEKGEGIRVRGTRGLTLLVEPDNEEKSTR